MPKKYENVKEYHDPWYALTANRLLVTLGALRDEVNCDVCVVGAGFTGLSAALELAQKGFNVILLEKDSVSGLASGRNGGHLQRGFSQSPGWLIRQYGLETAKFLCNVSLEGLGLMLMRMAEHDIKCDLKFGHLTAATKPRHETELKADIRDWQKLGHKDIDWWDEKTVQETILTGAYTGGLFDTKGGHFHPLNYALGLAQAFQKHGGRIYEQTAAVDIIPGETNRVTTASGGSVLAKFVVLAGVTGMKGLAPLRKTSMAVTAHMIATEPLSETRRQQIMTRDIAVADARFIMDYYRFSSDNRLLFGGNCNYSDREYASEDMRLRERMTTLFPLLRMTRIDHCWRGPLDLTMNRIPHLGRLTPQIYFAHGFGGQGAILTHILGKIMAEAVAGTAERFDVFAKMRHNPFPGGDLLKRPLFVAAMTWYRLRDML
ncbi:MAG: FAD-binding oxidoreductase [Alphaproteobacteria bacterium]|nr:FAD-binding oxidoreductase [Alphaproteobacteria bacterium]